MQTPPAKARPAPAPRRALFRIACEVRMQPSRYATLRPFECQKLNTVQSEDIHRGHAVFGMREKKSDRSVQAGRRRLPLFPNLRERPAFRPIILPLKAAEGKILVAVRGAAIGRNASNTLHALAIDSDRLKREFDELQQLRKAVAEAERANINPRQQPVG